MQVVHDNTGITHAVLGKGQTLDFRASTSAQVLFLLSTGLYKYPKLASVREIICNGWDAHIVSGKRDCPVQITISDKGVLSVRDFGTGIAHDMIQEIYLTAGESTKENNDEETGGFGLGSKAPFAYRDHFTVISTHQGVRTMYAMAMSDSQSMGKPTAKVLHQGPSDKDGVEVQMQLRENDIEQFEKIIRRVVYMGDINATFNGEKMDVCGMDEADTDLSILAKKYDGDMYTNLQLGVRYGAVVYPLETGDDFRDEFNELLCLLRDKFGGLRNCMLVLRAKPNSISMTPSREALLYNPRTTATVIELINAAKARLMEAASVDHRDHLKLIIQKTVLAGYSPCEMLSWRTDHTWPTVHSENDEKAKFSFMTGLTDTYAFADDETSFTALDLLHDQTNAHTPSQYALWYVVHNYQAVMRNAQSRAYWRSEMYRLATMFGEFNPQTVRLLGRNDKPHVKSVKRLLHSQITLPFLKATRELMPDAPKKLHAFLTDSPNAGSASRWNSASRTHSSPDEKTVFNMFPQHLPGSLATLCDPVIMLVWDAKNLYGETKGWYRDAVKNPKHAFVYYLKLSRGKHDPRALAKQLHKHGFKVVDRTPQHGAYLDRLKEEARTRAAELREQYALLKERGELKEKRATKESMASLANVMAKGDLDMDSWLHIKTPAMVEGPVAVLVRRANSKTKLMIDDMGEEVTRALVKRYGTQVGITNRTDTANRFYQAGAKSFSEFVIAEMTEALKESPEILQYVSDMNFFKDKEYQIHDDYSMRKLLKNALYLPQFCEKLGMPSLTEDQQFWLRIFEQLKGRGHYSYWGYNPNTIRLPEVSKNAEAILARLQKAKCDSKSLMKTMSDYVVTDSKLRKMHPNSQVDLTDFLFKITYL